MKFYASLAQLVEQLIRNEQVVGSSPIGGSVSKCRMGQGDRVMRGKGEREKDHIKLRVNLSLPSAVVFIKAIKIIPI